MDDQSHAPESVSSGDDRVTRIIRASWRNTLKVASVDDDADFFELGGHSIVALRIASYLRRELGMDVDILQIWETPIFSEFKSAVLALLAEPAERG